MQFNLDSNKQANEDIFSQESNSSNLTYPLSNLTTSALLNALMKNS